MSVTMQCPQCGMALSADAPGGLCPECLLRQGLDSAAFSASRTPTVIGAGFVPPTPAELASRFPQLEILALLGKGGMGAVYKARQRGLDRMVALKVLPPEVGKDPAFAERFSREARALARLNHHNIVAVYDFGEADGLFYFVMEYVDGSNVRHLLQGGHVTPAEALAIVPQICAALQFAHEEGIVHRDVKPENILIDRRGRVKIADFGLAKLLRVQPTDVTLTQAQQVMGTWHYMAPEQVEHPQDVDHRADIYSLGVVFYEMLTGQLPLGRFDLPSQKAPVDARIDQVVLRALEREPERRYQYASEVQTDVERITGTAPASAAPLNAVRFPPLDLRRALDRVKNPAIGLFLAGLLYWLMIPLAFLLWSTGATSIDEFRAGLWWSFLMQPALAGTLLMFGGAKMRRLEAYPLVMFAGFAPLLILIGNVSQMLVLRSFGFSPGDLVGPAMGLWTLIVVTSPSVKAAFAGQIDSEGTTQRNGDREASQDSGTSESVDNPVEKDRKDSGWGCLIVPILVFVIAPLFQFVAAAVADVNDYLLDKFGLDTRLQRPLLGALWTVLIGALAYAGFQLYKLAHSAEPSGSADGTEPGTAAEQTSDRRIRWAKLGSSLFPVALFVVLVLSRPGTRDGGGATTTPADAPVSAQVAPLLQAATDGDVKRIRELIAVGADVNSVEPQSGDTPLIRAAGRGHTALMVTLILLGADVNAQNRQSESALMRAAENGRTATIRALFDLRQLTWEDDVEKRKAALRAFPGFDRSLIAGRDLDLADLKIEEMLRDENGETASMKALRAQDPECFELLANNLDNLRARDKRGRTVAMHAAMAGRVDLYRWLRHEALMGSAGVDNVFVGLVAMFDFEQSLALLDNDGKSALQIAEEHGQKEIAEILRAHFEAIVANQTREIEKGETNAEKHRHLRGLALQALGRTEQAQLDLATRPPVTGRELLDAAAAGNVAVLRRLIAEDADVNAADPQTGETPLMSAAANGQSAAAVVLLMRRANEQARDRKKMTPVMHAVLGGHADLVQLLAEMGSISWDEEVQFRVSRLDAEMPADTDFKSMHFDAALEAQDENGETALMKAAARGDEEIVTILLRWSGNEAARDREGRTALMHAIANDQTAFLKTMIDGAEALLPHAPPGYTKTGFVTPEVLSVTDQDGKTALVLAREEGLEAIAAALQTYLQHIIDNETRGIEAQGPYLWYIYHTRGHAYLGLGQIEAGKADLAKARELNQQKP